MPRKVRPLLAILIGALALAGCSAGLSTTAGPVSGDGALVGNNDLSVTGGVALPPSSTVAPGAANHLASSPLLVSASSDSLPFVRSRPEAVAPFPLVLNRTVQRYVDGYLSQPQGLDASFRRSNPFMAEMVAVLEDQGLPKDLVYLTFAESEFSDTGAGPWQLNRDTARRYGLSINRWVDERRDPIKSTRAAAAYLASLHDQVDADWQMTLIAWNNGASGVDRYRNLRDLTYDVLVRRLPQRTRELLNRFMAVAMIARHCREYGITQADYRPTPSYRVVEVKGGTPLKTLAARVRSSVWMLHLLNPGLLRDAVPPSGSYAVRVPAAAGGVTAANSL